jgi:hypothetical protein
MRRSGRKRGERTDVADFAVTNVDKLSDRWDAGDGDEHHRGTGGNDLRGR